MTIKQTAGQDALDEFAPKFAKLNDDILFASMLFPIGQPNDGFAQYFSGKSFLAPVSKEQVRIFRVTFEPHSYPDLQHGF